MVEKVGRNSICYVFVLTFKPGFSDQSYVLSCVFVFIAEFNNLLPRVTLFIRRHVASSVQMMCKYICCLCELSCVQIFNVSQFLFTSLEFSLCISHLSGELRSISWIVVESPGWKPDWLLLMRLREFKLLYICLKIILWNFSPQLGSRNMGLQFSQ